jgi:hypothetical protein
MENFMKIEQTEAYSGKSAWWNNKKCFFLHVGL